MRSCCCETESTIQTYFVFLNHNFENLFQFSSLGIRHQTINSATYPICFPPRNKKL
jgi:hypothetical protein